MIKKERSNKEVAKTVIWFFLVFLAAMILLKFLGALDSEKIEAESRAEIFCLQAGRSGIDYIERYGEKYIFNCSSEYIAYYDDEFNSGYIKWPVD